MPCHAIVLESNDIPLTYLGRTRTTTKFCKKKYVQQTGGKKGGGKRIYLVEMKQVADCVDEFKERLSQLLESFGCDIYVIYVRIVKNSRSGVEKKRENRNTKGGFPFWVSL